MRAIRVDSTCVMAYYNLGNALHDCGRLDEAIEYFQRAVELDNTYVDAHFNLGIAYQEYNDFKNALKCYDTCASLDPTFVEAIEASQALRSRGTKSSRN
mmetsp:Transcript_28759/g.46911  ORF Transcript_28759/g.46911 Transcript_28759/m.46911 type:complete len:99 (+) Transcript_28759:709-1005(+)